MPNEQSNTAFDEQAVLAELERLQSAIRATRHQREQAAAAFDEFLRHSTYVDEGQGRSRVMKRDAAAPPASVRPEPPAPPFEPRWWDRGSAPAPAGRAQSDASRPEPSPERRSVGSLHAIDEFPARQEPIDLFGDATSENERRPTLSWRLVLFYVVVLVVAVPVYIAVSRRMASTAVPSQAAAEQTQTGTSAPARAAAAGATQAVQIELIAARPVWMRVTVDGQRVFEREMRLAEHLRFGADRAIVIRAGDAGAVRLSRQGRDLGTLGRDGEVVTKAFAAPPTTGRR